MIMYRMKEFSILSKTTIKTLRYYEKEGIFAPYWTHPVTKYRFYDSQQLVTLARVVSLRQLGFSIADLKKITNGKEVRELLQQRKQEIEKNLDIAHEQLLRINYLLEGNDMNYEVLMKTLPNYIVYYKEGIIKDFNALTEFILSSAEECKKENPNLKCVEPDYCYVNYLDPEFKDHNLKVRYAQAVCEMGKENETIHFEQLKEMKAACIYHKGAYENLGSAYGFIMNWIKENGYQMIDSPRERYIDGMWNKENSEDWLTEIQVPVQIKK